MNLSLYMKPTKIKMYDGKPWKWTGTEAQKNVRKLINRNKAFAGLKDTLQLSGDVKPIKVKITITETSREVRQILLSNMFQHFEKLWLQANSVKIK